MHLSFQPLSLDDQTRYNRLLDACPQKASDYSFVNLWAWRNIYGLEWAWDENLVWIRQNSPEPAYWAPVGPWAEVDWKTRLRDRLTETTSFIRIPEDLFTLWREACHSGLELESNPDHWDYVYSVTELIELRGNRFHKKKNLRNQFERKYEYSYIPLTTREIELALTLQAEWCLWRDCEDSTTLEAENQAIINTLQDWSSLERVMGGGIEVDGNMVAYTVAEPLDDQTVVIHFEKGCPQHKGVYQAINQLFLARSAAQFEYVNREQDLGDPGLRKAKESYNPIGYLKKLCGLVKPDELA